MNSKMRSAFSLLEVIIATGILATSAALLLGLFATGEKHATRAEERVMAQMICQSVLDELLATADLPESIQDQPLETYPDWTCSVDWAPLEMEGLVRLRVSVAPVAGPRENTVDFRDATPTPAFELVRWIRDRRTVGEGSEPDPQP